MRSSEHSGANRDAVVDGNGRLARHPVEDGHANLVLDIVATHPPVDLEEHDRRDEETTSKPLRHRRKSTQEESETAYVRCKIIDVILHLRWEKPAWARYVAMHMQ